MMAEFADEKNQRPLMGIVEELDLLRTVAAIAEVRTEEVFKEQDLITILGQPGKTTGYEDRQSYEISEQNWKIEINSNDAKHSYSDITSNTFTEEGVFIATGYRQVVGKKFIKLLKGSVLIENKILIRAQSVRIYHKLKWFIS
jgi:hypothetical protein